MSKYFSIWLFAVYVICPIIHGSATAAEVCKSNSDLALLSKIDDENVSACNLSGALFILSIGNSSFPDANLNEIEGNEFYNAIRLYIIEKNIKESSNDLSIFLIADVLFSDNYLDKSKLDLYRSYALIEHLKQNENMMKETVSYANTGLPRLISKYNLASEQELDCLIRSDILGVPLRDIRESKFFLNCIK